MSARSTSGGNKVTFAILGAVLIVGISSALAVMASRPGAGPSTSHNGAQVSTDTSTPTDTPDGGAGADATPLPGQPTATPRPTVARTPTPTRPPGSQIIEGSVGSVSSSSFVLDRDVGGAITIYVNTSTTYDGFTGMTTGSKPLSSEVGWDATVTCVQQSNGTYLASHVQTQPGA